MINGIANCDNINFIINNIKFFVPVVNLLAKGLKDQFIGMNIKRKLRIKIR